MEIPDSVREVMIFADKDRSQTGMRAALSLQARLTAQGISVRFVTIQEEIPETSKGIDFNDLLCRRGKTGIVAMLT